MLGMIENAERRNQNRYNTHPGWGFTGIGLLLGCVIPVQWRFIPCITALGMLVWDRKHLFVDAQDQRDAQRVLLSAKHTIVPLLDIVQKNADLDLKKANEVLEEQENRLCAVSFYNDEK